MQNLIGCLETVIRTGEHSHSIQAGNWYLDLLFQIAHSGIFVETRRFKCINGTTKAAKHSVVPIVSHAPSVSHPISHSPSASHSDIPSLVPTGAQTETPSFSMSPTETPLPEDTNVPTVEASYVDSSPTAPPTLVIEGQQDASCSLYPACAALNLKGDCCPTEENVFLKCCTAVPPPTPNPSPSPVIAPVTDQPTVSPTQKPSTEFPTASPTKSPTTKAPTNEPTSDPTKGTTREPSPQPTKSPTRAPAPEPTTQSPVEAPETNAPTPKTTESPVEAPVPENPPTSSPVERPTDSPSTIPVIRTSETVANAPSVAPSTSPAPTRDPTESFEFEMMTLSEKGVRLVLRNSGGRVLEEGTSDECTKRWQEDVRQRIETEIQNVIPKVEDLDVDVSNAKTEIDEAVVLIFDVLIKIRSPVEEHDISRYLEGPFDTEFEKQSFADFLRSTGCPEFANVGAVDVVMPKSEKGIDEGDSSSDNNGLIAGLALAITAVILLCATFIYVRSRNKQEREEDSHEMPLFTGESRNSIPYASEVEVESTSKYEISTLGDPIPVGMLRNPDSADASTIGTQSVEYDFNRAFADVQSTTESQLTGSLEHSSLIGIGFDTNGNNVNPTEEEFEVVAPAGLLGLILESDVDDGRPTVFNVKPNSVLFNVVRIGDRLLAVDNEDVRQMQASDVSQLIASKRDQKSRILSFARPKNVNPVVDEASEFD